MIDSVLQALVEHLEAIAQEQADTNDFLKQIAGELHAIRRAVEARTD